MHSRVLWILGLLLWPAFLSAQTVCVDPGHGGDDPGAVGCGLNEKDVNLDTSLRLRDLLAGAGFTALMTRDTDVFVSLVGRADYANANGADRFVCIHSNSNSGTPATGTETFCATSASSNSVDLRDKIQAEMISAWGLANRGGKTANFTVLTATAMPATLTEMGFINNCDVDATYLGSPDHRQEAAAAHLRAIQLHFGQNPTDTGWARGTVFEDQGVGTDDMSIRLEGATVTVSQTGDSQAALGETADWSFTLLPGTYTLQASQPGYQSNSRSCTVAANATAWCSIGLFPEAIEPDAGTEDAGVEDAGLEDAGVEDAGGEDAGGEDAGQEDAGLEDAGVHDAGEPDAGSDDDGSGLEPDTGCACSSAGATQNGLAGLILAFGLSLWLGRRRLALVLLSLGLLAGSQAQAGDLQLKDFRQVLRGDFRSPVLSPDGERLLLSSSGLESLYLLELQGNASQPRLLQRGPRVGFAAEWSADSKRVALRNACRPFAETPGWIDLRGEQLGRAPLAWWVRVEQADDAIWLVSPAGRQRLDPGGDRYFAPHLSPSGRYLVFEGLQSGLHLIRLSDGQRFALGAGHHPAFGGPDDGLLVYDQSRDDGQRLIAGELQLCRLGKQAPACGSLTMGSPAIEQEPSLSRDGSQLAFVTGDGSVWMARLAE